MKSIDHGQTPRLHKPFWIFQWKARKPLVWCFLFLVALYGAFMLPSESAFLYLVASALGDAKIDISSFTWFVELIIALASFVALSISWAILPILSMFPETGFATILRLQLCGALRNWLPFCYFILLVGGLFFLLLYLVYLAETYFSFMPPFFVEIGVVAFLWPVTFIWRLSAARHIFMIWE